MEYSLKKNEQFECPEIIIESNKTIRSKPNISEEYQKLMKNIETNEKINNSTESLYSDVAMVYPISSWTFWYRNPSKLNLRYPWEESLTKIETVRDVTHLWKVLNHIIQPSAKSLNTCLFVFNEKSVPAWEHKSNENAGRWIIILKDNHNLHNIWNNMILQIVGDKFEAVITDINGIGLHIKPVCSKMTVWTTKITLSNYKNIQNIGEKDELRSNITRIVSGRQQYYDHIQHNVKFGMNKTYSDQIRPDKQYG